MSNHLAPSGIMKLALAGALAWGAGGCREPMADDPGYRATVTCTQKMHGRSAAGQGTRNDAKALCIGVIGDRYRAEPKGNYDTLADCILGAPDEASAKACAASAPGSHLATSGRARLGGASSALRAGLSTSRPSGRRRGARSC